MMRHIAANALTILILAIAALGVLVMWGKGEFSKPGPLAEAVIGPVEPGDGLAKVTKRLVEAGAIKNETVFRLGARYTKVANNLKFGEYEIPPEASMQDILAVITSGRGVSYAVTVVEGWTSWQVVEKLKTVELLTGEIAEIPPEGSLAPNTYSYNRGESRQALIDKMLAAQVDILEEAWLNRDPETPLKSREEALILASIVEKETGLADERPLVASVFVNRLERGMRLQTDPTVIYGLTEGKGSLGRGLRRSELDKATPFNTYIIEGLPPTPIANPGKAAILATLNPDTSDFIFFVADGTGGHAFAKTLAEHNRNVRAWRAIEAERAKAAETN